MPEVALNLPFDSNEIKEIAVAEFKKRLDQLSPIQGTKEYAAFDLEFQVKIRVRRAGDPAGKETLAWGKVIKTAPDDSITSGQLDKVDEIDEIIGDTFTAEDPNTERMGRDMPLTIETTDGRGGKTRRKARIKE